MFDLVVRTALTALAAGGVALAGAAAEEQILPLGSYEAAGIRVEVTAARPLITAGAPPLTALREGDNVSLRFRVVETTSGAPVRGAQPVAWLSLLGQGEVIEPKKTLEKVESFLSSGSVLGRPEVDLNTYFVLVLNTDATISVIDPLMGFSGSKLLATVALPARGEDWALSPEHNRLFVSTPGKNSVAVIETLAWTLQDSIEVGRNPSRLGIQPDGHYLWIVNEGSGTETADAGVTVVSVTDRQVRAHLATGRGPYEIAFTENSRYALVLNRGSASLSVIDVAALRKLHDIPVGSRPSALGYSRLSRTAFVTDEESGLIRVVSPGEPGIVAEVQAPPGACRIGFPDGGRFGLLLNERENTVQVIDSATNRIVQRAVVDQAPYALAFSDSYAYIRHRAVPKVLLIPLSALAADGRPLALAAFDGGQKAPSSAGLATLPSDMAPAPEGGAVLLAHRNDKAVYYYQEGMAAPMGQFSTYGHEPRAVLSLDRGLKERRQPGVYETTVRLGAPGAYEMVFMTRSPRLRNGFAIEIQPSPELERSRLAGAVRARATIDSRLVKVGRPVIVDYAIANAADRTPAAKVPDLGVLAFLAPGVWQKRLAATEREGGIYRIEFTPPRAGYYYLTLFRAGEIVPLEEPGQLIVKAVPE